MDSLFTREKPSQSEGSEPGRTPWTPGELDGAVLSSFLLLCPGPLQSQILSPWYPKHKTSRVLNFSGGPVVKKSALQAGDAGSISGRGTKIQMLRSGPAKPWSFNYRAHTLL